MMFSSTSIHDVVKVKPFIVCVEASAATIQLHTPDGRHEIVIFANSSDDLRERLLELEGACRELRQLLNTAPTPGADNQGGNVNA